MTKLSHNQKTQRETFNNYVDWRSLFRSNRKLKPHLATNIANSSTLSTGKYYRQILDNLPAALYTTDLEGRITYYNRAAETLWGVSPTLGESTWCGSWKLFWPDGRVLPHSECPMAIAIKERRDVRGFEAIAERPDGTRVPFIPFPTLLLDDAGGVAGAVNMLVDISDRKRAEEAIGSIAAIVNSSADAVIGKALDGRISSWNAAAEKMFGYSAKEVIGKAGSILIPAERRDEEPEILARVCRGELVKHYETLRRHKDGSLLEISLSVSPILGGDGRVIGASKIARDISERRRAAEQQQLLLREMDHRVKNLFTLASGLVALSARTTTDPAELVSAIQGRLNALARVHALTTYSSSETTARSKAGTTLHALIRTVTSPYDTRERAADRVAVTGHDLPLDGSPMTSFALLLYELTTNSAKYGALSTSSGLIDIGCKNEHDYFELVWRERGGPLLAKKPDTEGFGGLLIRKILENQFAGSLSYDWKPEGLVVRMVALHERLSSGQPQVGI